MNSSCSGSFLPSYLINTVPASTNSSCCASHAVPVKASTPTSLIWLGSASEFAKSRFMSEEQLKKALSPMTSIKEWNSTVIRSVSFANSSALNAMASIGSVTKFWFSCLTYSIISLPARTKFRFSSFCFVYQRVSSKEFISANLSWLPSSKYISSSCVQPSKASAPILRTSWGINMYSRLMQLANALSPISRTDGGRMTRVNPSIPAKASSPIYFKLYLPLRSGTNLISVMLWLLAKAKSPILTSG